MVLPLRDADGAHTRADDVAAWPVEERVQVQLVRCVPRGLCGGRAARRRASPLLADGRRVLALADVLTCWRAGVLTCCRAVVLSCCRAVVLCVDAPCGRACRQAHAAVRQRLRRRCQGRLALGRPLLPSVRGHHCVVAVVGNVPVALRLRATCRSARPSLRLRGAGVRALLATAGTKMVRARAHKGGGGEWKRCRVFRCMHATCARLD